MPRVPLPCPKNPCYAFHEMFKFEAGLIDLTFDNRKGA